MNHRQPRTYPILGLLVANLLRYMAVAKVSELSAPLLEYKPDKWLSYNKPIDEIHPEKHDDSNNDHWNPVIPLDEQQVTPHTEFLSNNNQEYYDKDHFDSYQIEPNLPNEDLQYAASETKLVRKRHPSYNNFKHAGSKPLYLSRRSQFKATTERPIRYRNGQKRKGYTTASYYYDSSEEITRPPKYRPKKRMPSRYHSRRTTTESYEEYDDYYEATTLPPRRQRPVLNKRKRRPIYEYYEDNTDEYENSREIVTETLNVKQRQQSTTEEATDSTPTSTSGTTQTTASTNATTPNSMNSTMNATYPYGNGSNNDNISITYGPPEHDYFYPTFTGYGPSNGNENISITYGPPTRVEYLPPFQNWYTPQIKPQDIVRTIHDIVDFDINTVNRRIT